MTQNILWRQTIADISIIIITDKDVRSSDVSILFGKNQLKIAIKGEEILKGDYFKKVDLEECIWTLNREQDYSVVEIELEKMDKDQFWERALVGVDIQELDPPEFSEGGSFMDSSEEENGPIPLDFDQMSVDVCFCSDVKIDSSACRECLGINAAIMQINEEERKLRIEVADTWGDVFKTRVGQFWGIYETRPYMRAKSKLIHELLTKNTNSSLKESLNHGLDCLRLCRSDNMGLRSLIPSIMLRLGLDQDCYDFVKWWATCDPDGRYDWGNMSLPYLSVKNADVFESLDWLTSRNSELQHVCSLAIIKIKLITGLTDMRNSDFLSKSLPTETVDHIKDIIPKSSAIPKSFKMSKIGDYDDLLVKLKQQVQTLVGYMKGENEFICSALRNPQKLLNAPDPQYFSCGSIEEAQLTLSKCYMLWRDTPTALDYLK